MKKFSREHIEQLLNKAPALTPSLINEFYEALERGGAEEVNTLFNNKGTFEPKFQNRKDVIRFIALMKQFSGIILTSEEQAVVTEKS